jgi:phage gpG-like protein
MARGAFAPLLNDLGNLASPDLGVRLRGAIAVEAERQLLAGFKDSRDPYGRAWKPVARGGKPLMDTGNLRGSRVSTTTAGGVEVGLAAPYASYQQFGTRAHRGAQGARRRALGARKQILARGGITPRPMLPFDGLGRIWSTAFERVAARVLRGGR